MIENTTIEKLKKLLTHKKSKEFYSRKLGVSVDYIDHLLAQIRGDQPDLKPDQDYESQLEINIENKTLKSSVVSDFEPKSLEELIKLHKIDSSKYRVSNYWTKQKGNKFTSSLLCTEIKPTDKDNLSEKFMSFLKTYSPKRVAVEKPSFKLDKSLSFNESCLILPKQDAHFNKYDSYGDNDIDKRFESICQSTFSILSKAALSSKLSKIYYIVGSDQFNSEFTQTTTKGTPQSNILDYNSAFNKICNHEVEIIDYLCCFSDDVEILYIPGNHDEYVGWHLAEWLKAFYRSEKKVSICTDIKNRKYDIFGSSALMFNHGDALKPNELAHKFPIEFRVGWSSCENFYCFTGDKHHEMSKDIHGIEFYQVPQLSNAKSRWDDKNGHTCSKAKMTAFLINKEDGMTDIYKKPIK